MQIKSVIFDLDDTLYNEKMFVINGFKKVSLHLNGLTGVEFYDIYKFLLNDLIKNGRGENFNSLVNFYNLENLVSIDELLNIYRTNDFKLDLYEDAKFTLNYLGPNYKLGLITDGNVVTQKRKITNLSICNIFDKIIITDEYGVSFRKPNEKAYLNMLNYFNHYPEESIYVGDNPYKDFINAKKIGMKTIRLIRGAYRNISIESDYEADIQIKYLTEIISHIED